MATSKQPKQRKRSLVFEIGARVLITLIALGFFLMLRPDFVEAGVHRYRRYVASPSLISEYLDSHETRKLQIGSGENNFEGWLNTEYIPQPGQAYLDATTEFPLPDDSFDYVFSEHVIEHFPYEDGLGMLKESYRVLKPGGRIRVVTPNLDKLIGLFTENPNEDMQRYIAEKFDWHDHWPQGADPTAIVLNMELHDFGHEFVYNPVLLTESLEKAGFKNVKVYLAGESEDPELTHLEGRVGTNRDWPNRYESMALEAEK